MEEIPGSNLAPDAAYLTQSLRIFVWCLQQNVTTVDQYQFCRLGIHTDSLYYQIDYSIEILN